MKISVNNILLILALFILILIAVYAYLSFCLTDGSLKTFSADIVLSLINGLFLALVVFVAGIFIEEKRRKEIEIQSGNEELSKLRNILLNVLNRGKSSWNFSNRTPTFYFDNTWTMPLYDLLIQNNREWDTFLREYATDNPDSEIARELISFVDIMEQALINTEKIDNSLRRIKLNPGLAVSMQSGYSGDRIDAKKNTEFTFWVFRASWAGANSTETMFGMPSATDQQISFEKIEGLMKEATSLGETKEFGDLIKQLREDGRKLEKLLKTIKKHLR